MYHSPDVPCFREKRQVGVGLLATMVLMTADASKLAYSTGGAKL